MDNMDLWEALASPPQTALKKITGGRLAGMHDINPQWRYQALTEQFGPCGVGWQFEVERLWTEPGPEGQVFAFAQVALRCRFGETWSEPIQGVGGSMLVAKESSGLHANDEAYKMAVTDSLSTACKMIGVAADVYLGQYDTKHSQFERAPSPSTPPTPQKSKDGAPGASDVPLCPKCGGKMWDNRVGKRNPRAPDFKCRDKNCAEAIWLTPRPEDEGPPPGFEPPPFDPNDDPF